MLIMEDTNKSPIIIVIEDCQKIDLISNTFICLFKEKIRGYQTNFRSIFLICSYQVKKYVYLFKHIILTYR